jgi:hypothetical protein
MIEFKRETITPAKAEKMLKASNDAGFRNRSPSSSFVNRYARDMGKSHWQTDTGETIKVSKCGAVIDGQHRLFGIIAAGIPVKVWVCYGIDIGMFQYIDQGKSRDLKDIMSIDGWVDPAILAVTGKMLWRHDRCGEPLGSTTEFNESDGNIYNWVMDIQPDLQSQWKSYKPMIRKIYNSNHKAIPESVMFYLLYQWMKEDVDAALLFAGYLADDGTSEPPHRAMKWFADYCIEVKMEDMSSTRNRHGDFKEKLVKGADYAWLLVTEGRKSVSFSGFKTGLSKHNTKRLSDKEAA